MGNWKQWWPFFIPLEMYLLCPFLIQTVLLFSMKYVRWKSKIFYQSIMYNIHQRAWSPIIYSSWMPKLAIPEDLCTYFLQWSGPYYFLNADICQKIRSNKYFFCHKGFYCINKLHLKSYVVSKSYPGTRESILTKI